MNKIKAKRVYKHELNLGLDTLLNIPKGNKILKCAEQYGKIYLWALVDIDRILEPGTEGVFPHLKFRRFRIYGTGHNIVQLPGNIEYVDTVLMAGGSLVWHIFELK